MSPSLTVSEVLTLNAGSWWF